MNRRVVIFDENENVVPKQNDEAKKEKKVRVDMWIDEQKIALSDANSQQTIPQTSFSPKRKRVKFASTSPEVCVFNKDESAVEIIGSFNPRIRFKWPYLETYRWFHPDRATNYDLRRLIDIRFNSQLLKKQYKYNLHLALMWKVSGNDD